MVIILTKIFKELTITYHPSVVENEAFSTATFKIIRLTTGVKQASYFTEVRTTKFIIVLILKNKYSLP